MVLTRFIFSVSHQCNHGRSRQLHCANLYKHSGKDGQEFSQMLGKVRTQMTLPKKNPLLQQGVGPSCFKRSDKASQEQNTELQSRTLKKMWLPAWKRFFLVSFGKTLKRRFNSLKKQLFLARKPAEKLNVFFLLLHQSTQQMLVNCCLQVSSQVLLCGSEV